jgi:phosphoribosylformylglycinamidine cyclo-ligase
VARDPQQPYTYTSTGVDTDAAAVGLRKLLDWVSRTQEYREGLGESLVPNGFFASVLRLSSRLALAVSTDGVGSKSVIAQMMGSYEAMGVDCVAVNVNDIICTGAEPIALLDYISLQVPHEDLLEQLGKGLQRGAERARIAIVGGELSQHPDTLIGPRPGYAFDIAGTGLGVLDDRAPITGKDILPGDVILGLSSDGVHSNGLTLARPVLLGDDGKRVERFLESCGRTVGEELLRPTHIYTREVAALLAAGVHIGGLAHISGDGLLNLLRLDAAVGYRITSLPPVPPVFDVIQREGNISSAEMFRVFNMGIGFCVVVRAEDVDNALAVLAEEQRADGGASAYAIGEVVAGPQRRVVLEEYHLVGEKGKFYQQTG